MCIATLLYGSAAVLETRNSVVQMLVLCLDLARRENEDVVRYLEEKMQS